MREFSGEHELRITKDDETDLGVRQSMERETDRAVEVVVPCYVLIMLSLALTQTHSMPLCGLKGRYEREREKGWKR